MNFWEQEKKVEFLQRYQRSLNDERRILDSIQWLRMRYAVPSMKELDGMPRGSGQPDLSDYMAKLSDLYKQYVDQLQATLTIRLDTLRAIDEMYDSKEKDVLRYRYIELLTWEKVAEKVGVQVRWTHELHIRALKHLRIS